MNTTSGVVRLMYAKPWTSPDSYDVGYWEEILAERWKERLEMAHCEISWVFPLWICTVSSNDIAIASCLITTTRKSWFFHSQKGQILRKTNRMYPEWVGEQWGLTVNRMVTSSSKELWNSKLPTSPIFFAHPYVSLY